MCYDTAQLAYRIYRDAIRLKASPEEIEDLRKKWKELEKGQPDFYHVSGFQHPEMIVFTKEDDRLDMIKAVWGLIPNWVKDEEKAQETWNHTLNARGETMFEKPSFRNAAHHRCILPVDGFFDFFHLGKKTFPYYIQREDGERLFIGAIRSEWVNPTTGEIINSFSLVTTHANEFVGRIHNKPVHGEPRMPLLVNDEDAEIWFSGAKEEVMQLIRPNLEQHLTAKTVHSLRGKNYIGNCEEIVEEVKYEELMDADDNQTSLF